MDRRSCRPLWCSHAILALVFCISLPKGNQRVAQGFSSGVQFGGSPTTAHHAVTSTSLWRRVIPRPVSCRDQRMYSTPENSADKTSGEEETAAAESENDIWARAELPMSNDQQIQQATGAVWRVRNGLAAAVPADRLTMRNRLMHISHAIFICSEATLYCRSGFLLFALPFLAGAVDGR